MSDQQSVEAPSEPSGLTKITVNLTPRSMAALEQGCNLTGDTKTDSVNRAQQLYAFMVRMMGEGWSVHLQSPDGTKSERVHLF